MPAVWWPECLTDSRMDSFWWHCTRDWGCWWWWWGRQVSCFRYHCHVSQWTENIWLLTQHCLYWHTSVSIITLAISQAADCKNSSQLILIISPPHSDNIFVYIFWNTVCLHKRQFIRSVEWCMRLATSWQRLIFINSQHMNYHWSHSLKIILQTQVCNVNSAE